MKKNMNKIIVENSIKLECVDTYEKGKLTTRMLEITQLDGGEEPIYIDFVTIPELIKCLQKANKTWWENICK